MIVNDGGSNVAGARYAGQARAYQRAYPNANIGPNPNIVGADAPGSDGSNVPSSPFSASPAMDDAWITGNDDIYKSQEGALKAARDLALQKIQAERSTYESDYGNALRKLGFNGDVKSLDSAKWDPNAADGNSGWMNNGKPVDVSWNENDRNTAAGRGLHNTLNDFASRGMLQSSAYAQARNDLFRSLNDQLASTTTAKTKAEGDFTNSQTEQTNSYNLAIQNALNEARNRLSGMVTG